MGGTLRKLPSRPEGKHSVRVDEHVAELPEDVFRRHVGRVHEVGSIETVVSQVVVKYFERREIDAILSESAYFIAGKDKCSLGKRVLLEALPDVPHRTDRQDQLQAGVRFP